MTMNEFCSGENRRAMHRAFLMLVEALRTNDFSVLGEICTADCKADFSTVGHLSGIEEMQKKLAWKGPDTNVSRATVWNFTARSSETRGQQTAYVQFIRAIEDGEELYPFLYGGEFANSFVCDNGVWKFSHIRFDLCYEEGNNLFVYPDWKLIDYAKYCGHEPMINAELDNPWLVIPDDCEPQTDEEQIFELMYRYAFAFDHGDFRFLQSFVTEDFFINGSKHRKDYWSAPLESGDFLGHRMVSDFLRDKYHKEAKMMHACRMGSIEMHGDTAVAYMPRGEEHRLKNRQLTHENVHSIFSTALHFIYAKKVEGVWKMYKYRIEPISEVIPTWDDCLEYHEYLLEGKSNESV